jgi:hypothetical protein
LPMGYELRRSSVPARGCSDAPRTRLAALSA